jgi:predicted GIY-YIG superfamily endonuclease
MHLSDDITEVSSISELTASTINSSSSSLLSSNNSSSGDSSTTSQSYSSDSMEEDNSDDSMSLSSNDTNEDSSSDYTPSASESDSDSSTIMDTSESESEEEDEDHYVPELKKCKRNPLDNFCLYIIRPKCPNDTNLYIGSTICFNRRKAQHKKAVTNKRGGTYHCILYRYIRKCGGWDNFTMEKILDYPCQTKHEGLLKEKEYIIKHEATLNSVMPVASPRLDVSQTRSTVSDFTERMNDI